MECHDYLDSFKKSALSFNIKDVHNKKSQYVGVSWKKSDKKWQARITVDGKGKHLGYYLDENEAARIYDEQAARFNRPMNFPQHEGQEQAVKLNRDKSKVPNVNRPSNYGGVYWNKREKKWEVKIMIDGKSKFLGYYLDENEAARIYDEQAARFNKPVNFPQHEGQEQVRKYAARFNKPVNFPQHEGQEQVTKYAARRDLSKLLDVNRPSKHVGVSWDKERKKWEAKIRFNGKSKHLGYYLDENKAARIYDEQAVLLNRPVNFPQHEGQEQAVKQRKDRSKVPIVMRRSNFVGVSYHKQMKKWVAKIVIDGKRKHLGLFDDEKEAACQYDKQAKLIDRPVNFPKEGQNKAKKNKCFDSIDNVQSKRTKIRYYPDD